MSRRKKAVPTYRLHKPTGQAFVRVYGDDGKPRYIYLGQYGSAESRARYAKIVEAAKIEEVAASNTIMPAKGDAWVGEICVAFLEFADRHYRDSEGKPTGEAENYRQAIRHLVPLYAETPARDFGPLALQRVRESMVASGICRSGVNRMVGRIKRVFRWAVAQELVSAEIAGALSVVEGLRRGRTEAHDPDPVEPVPLADVEKTIPHLTPDIAAMVQIQLLTGMRPGEVRAMTFKQIDRSGPIWAYRPTKHKTAWRGKGRAIMIGPKARAILEPIAGTIDDTEPIFSQDRAAAVKQAKRLESLLKKLHGRGIRANPPTPTQADNPRPYSGSAYMSAIRRAAKKAGVPHWHPNQLRHTFATMVRASHGLEAAQVLLGHEKADITQIYAERDLKTASKVIGEIG